MGWLRDLTDDKKAVSMMGFVPAYHNFMLFGNEHDDAAGLPEVWKINGPDNIKWLDENKDRVIGSIYDMPDHEGKVIILVGMSPTLHKAWEALRTIDDRFVIVATNSSAKFLVDRDIIPHYVITIDGKPGTWSLDLGEKCKDVVGIFSAYAEPEALRQWPGKIMIVPYGVKDKALYRKVKRRWGKGIASGGNSINGAFAIFVLHTNAKIFFFAGNELSFMDTYYADRESPNDELAYFFTKNIYGETVRTFIPLYEYKVWLENAMSQLWPEYHFCNCSEGILGVDVDGSLFTFISHKPLELAIQDAKDAFDFAEEERADKLKLIYDKFYDHDLGNLMRGKGVWQYVLECLMTPVKALDVGCGRANSVEYARQEGVDCYGCDISDSAIKCWKERGVEEYCSVCFAKDMPYEDEEFDMITCSEVMEHIPEEDTIPTLKEMARVSSGLLLFTIALREEIGLCMGYIQTHITIKPPQWWIDTMRESGLYILSAVHSPDMSDMTLLVTKYPDKYREFENCPLFALGGGHDKNWEDKYEL